MLSRLGVASRLLLAFLGISGLAMVGAAVAIFSFHEIGEVLNRITARRVPAAFASQEVSRQAERIISAAPALLSAATPTEHAQRSRNITTEMDALYARLDKFEDGGAESVALGSMRLAVNRLWTNLKSLDKLVADRIVLSERKRDQLRNALAIQSESQNLLTPWLQIVDGETAKWSRMIGDTALKAEERATAGTRLLGSIGTYYALQRVQFLITSMSDRLQQIATTDDADGLRVHVFRIQQALSEARQMTADLDSRLRPLLLDKLEELQMHAAGSDSIPELRQQELGIVDLANRHLNDNSTLSTDLTEAVDRLVSSAKRDIAEANQDALSVQKRDRSDHGRRAQLDKLHPDRLALCRAQHRLALDRAQSQHAGNCRRQSCDIGADSWQRRDRGNGRRRRDLAQEHARTGRSAGREGTSGRSQNARQS
jgi:phosphoglycerate-specific signal transduction histidine kinase